MSTGCRRGGITTSLTTTIWRRTMNNVNISLPTELCERGNSWFISEDGTSHAAWFKLPDGHFLVITVEPGDYPGFFVQVSENSEEYIAHLINTNLEGWLVRK